MRSPARLLAEIGLGLSLLGLAACGPKVNLDPSPFEEDDPRAGAPDEAEGPVFEELPVAPAGPGARTGTVDRATLAPILDAGPGSVLRHLEVTAETDGDKFRGWRLVAVDPGHHPFAGVDLQPGDVLVALNGRAILRPDDLQAVWDSLRSASEIVAELRRGDGRVELRWAITGEPVPAPAAPR